MAVDDDRVLGVVTYCPPGSPWREIGRDDEGEFRMLAVAPGRPGLGCGHRPRPAVRGPGPRARAPPGWRCRRSATMTAAHRIYARLGYARDPGRDWSPLPGRRPARLRQVLLSSAQQRLAWGPSTSSKQTVPHGSAAISVARHAPTATAPRSRRPPATTVTTDAVLGQPRAVVATVVVGAGPGTSPTGRRTTSPPVGVLDDAPRPRPGSDAEVTTHDAPSKKTEVGRAHRVHPGLGHVERVARAVRPPARRRRGSGRRRPRPARGEAVARRRRGRPSRRRRSCPCDSSRT